MALGIRELVPDPLLTDIAMEAGTGGGFAVEELVPRRSVERAEFKYAMWDVGLLTSDETETLVAPGDIPKRKLDSAITYVTGLVKSHGLREMITIADAAQAPNLNALERAKVNGMVWSLRRAKELRFRDLVNDTASVAHATPGVKWDAAGGTNVVIEANIDAAKALFRLQNGVPATHIIIPPNVSVVMKRDPTIRELIKYTQNDLLVNGDLPPTVFGLKVVIPGGIVNSAAAGAASALANIWTADNVVLAYVNMTAATDPTAMTCVCEFGVGFEPGGAAFPTMSYPDPEPSREVTWYWTKHSWTMEWVAGCLYIINDVLT